MTRPPGTLVPLALLIVLALLGLRGTISAPRWNGPLRGSGVVVAVVLVAVLLTLLVFTWLRHRTAREADLDVPAKLRLVLMAVLSAGIVATVVTMLIGLHLHVFTVTAHQRGPVPASRRPSVRPPAARGTPSTGSSVPVSGILYGLLILALIAAIVLTVRWSARLRPPVRPREEPGKDSEDLREAVESGRSALRSLDDARAAIIACYVAMEQSLAERGAARGMADTPDELLARAIQSQIVHGPAAARLTALFYEARFSSHPMNQSQRRAAEQALDELALALTTGGLVTGP